MMDTAVLPYKPTSIHYLGRFLHWGACVYDDPMACQKADVACQW
jgi:hypothetical protein